MAINAATLNIGVGVTGADSAVAAVKRVNAAVGKTGDRLGSAARTAANFGASMAQAGATSATALAGIAQQAGEIAFAFGPAGAVAGAVATATIAIVTLVHRSRKEVKDMKDEFKHTIDELANAGDYAALNKKARDILYGTVSDPGGLAELQKKRADLQAQLDKAVSERNLFLVSHLQRGIDDLNKKIKPLREQYDLVVQRIMTPDLRPGVQGMQQVTVAARDFDALAAQATRKRAQAVRELAAAQRELAKASEGITLEGPAVDLGINATEKAPTVPVQVVPRIPIDEAQAQLMLDMEALAPSLAQSAQQTLGQSIVNGFAAAFEGGNPVAEFGNTILEGLGSIFTQVGEALLGFGKIMAALQKFLTNIFTAGPAAIAAGAALIALGSAFTAITTGRGGGGSGGGGFGGGVGEVHDPAQITNITIGGSGVHNAGQDVTPVQPQTFNVFGPNDPMAQRAVIEAFNLGKGRNL